MRRHVTFFTYPKIKWNCPKGHMHRAESATAARPGRDLNDRREEGDEAEYEEENEFGEEDEAASAFAEGRWR